MPNNTIGKRSAKPTFYLVGGAVRDRLLGLPVKDRDWVVVGATPEWMLNQGYKPVGADFPVFIDPKTGEEYALARTERKTGRGYQGFTFYCAPEVTLAEDLQRRDLTINALAQSKDGEVIDLVGGQHDLQTRTLRHVSPAFIEDPLRVLRVARFFARYQPLGFVIADETLSLMRQLTQSGELEALTQERVLQELLKALETDAPQYFFMTLADIGALPILMPALANFLAHAPNKRLAFAALSEAVSRKLSINVRFACIAQGLAEEEQLETFCQTLKAPRDLLQLSHVTHILINFALHSEDWVASSVLNLLETTDAYRRPERFKEALSALQCNLNHLPNLPNAQKSKPENISKLFESAWAQTQNITGKSIMAAARARNETPPTGKAIGEAIAQQRVQIIEALLSKVQHSAG